MPHIRPGSSSRLILSLVSAFMRLSIVSVCAFPCAMAAQEAPPGQVNRLKDSGSVIRGVYINSMLGFSYPFPQDWKVISPSSAESSDPASSVSASQYRMLALVTRGHPFEITTISISLEKVGQLVGRNEPEILMDAAASGAKSRNKKFSPPTEETIAGRFFVRHEYKENVGGGMMYEASHFTIIHGNVVSFTVMSNNAVRIDDLGRSLQFLRSLTSAETGSTANTVKTPEESLTTDQAAPSTTAKTAEVIEGSISGNTYSNPYFNFSLKMPEGFRAQRKQEIEERIESGHRRYYGGNPEDDPEHVKARQMGSVLLRAIPEPKAPDEPNSLTVIAFNLSHYPSPTAGDFLTMVSSLGEARAGRGKLSQKGKPEVAFHGGEMFVRVPLEGRIEVGGKAVSARLAMYGTYARGYALIWTFAASNKDDLKKLETAMQSLQFPLKFAPM